MTKQADTQADTLTGSLIKVKALDPCVMDYEGGKATLIVGKVYDAEYNRENSSVVLIDEDGDRHHFAHPDSKEQDDTIFLGHPLESEIPSIDNLVLQGTNFAGILTEGKLHSSKLTMSMRANERDFTVHLCGTLGKDEKGRFSEGSYIRTSQVNEMLYSAQHNVTVVTTRNSTYFMQGDWFEDNGFHSMHQVDAETLKEMHLDGDLELPPINF